MYSLDVTYHFRDKYALWRKLTWKKLQWTHTFVKGMGQRKWVNQLSDLFGCPFQFRHVYSELSTFLRDGEQEACHQWSAFPHFIQVFWSFPLYLYTWNRLKFSNILVSSHFKVVFWWTTFQRLLLMFFHNKAVKMIIEKKNFFRHIVEISM